MFAQDKDVTRKTGKSSESIQIVTFWRCALEVVVRDGKWSFSILEHTHTTLMLNVTNLVLRFVKMTLNKCIFVYLKFDCRYLFVSFPCFSVWGLKKPQTWTIKLLAMMVQTELSETALSTVRPPVPLLRLMWDDASVLTEVWRMSGWEYEGPGRLLSWPLTQVLSGMTPLTDTSSWQLVKLQHALKCLWDLQNNTLHSGRCWLRAGGHVVFPW